MREWIRQYSALKGPARGLFLRATLLLPVISLSLKWVGFRKTKASLQHFLSVRYGSQSADAQARALLTAQMVRAAGSHGIGNRNCLKESIAVWWLLAREAIASELHLGVHKDGEKFEAHAWVECGGTPLNDPDTKLPDFAAFDTAVASLPREPR
jgi:Transglutaminase-like superfamily